MNEEQSHRFQEILNSYDSGQMELNDNVINNPFSSIEAAFRDFQEQIKTMLKKLFGIGEGQSHFNFESFWNILGEVLYYTLILLAFLVIFYLIWRVVNTGRFDAPVESDVGTKVDEQYILLEKLLNEKQFKEAIRLRWQIYLNIEKVQLSLTPLDFQKKKKPNLEKFKPVSGFYYSSFRASQLVRSDFDQFQEAIQVLGARSDA